MKQSNVYPVLSKIMSSSILCTGILVASLNAHGSTLQEISQVPLSLAEGVPPNIIVTIDDSTSMDRAYVPDGLGRTTYKHFRNNSFNAMYYNPEVTYLIPPSFARDGSEKVLNTRFDHAHLNGFRPEDNKRSYADLSKSYKVARDVYIRNSFEEPRYPDILNPVYDFKCSIKDTLLSKNGDVHACDEDTKDAPRSIRQHILNSRSKRTGKITITRTAEKKCSAVMEVDSQGVSIDAPCERKEIDGKYYYEADLTNEPVPAYYYKYVEDTENNTGGAKKHDGCYQLQQCYHLVFVTSNSGVVRSDDLASGRDERQNFANWYSFYRVRSLATISAASLAFYNLSPSARMTWQSLRYCTELNGGTSSKCDDNKFREFGVKHRGEFYHWIQQTLPMYSNTPLRAAMDRAGKFLNGSSSVAWHKYPNDPTKTNNKDNTYACRPSYHVLMTDGVWNSSDAEGDGKTYSDASTIDLPSGTGYTGVRPSQYTPVAPYSGGGSDTLADVAMNYWAMDLNTDLDNDIKAYMPFKSGNELDDYWDPRNNPADWQHMTNFIMGLGLTNSLSDDDIPWAGGTYLGEGYKKLKSGDVSWPTASGSIGRVYDLWHAAINSRGEFFSAENPEDMVAAFESILGRIADRKASATAPGVSTTLELDGDPNEPTDRFVNYFYNTTYDSENSWAGDVKKIKKYRQWNNTEKTYEDIEEDKWSAAQNLPAHAARNIMMANGTSGLQSFSETNAGNPNTPGTLAHWLQFNPDPSVQSASWRDRLKYLRGDRSKEGEEEGDLRQRSSVLGDFLSSKPVVVSGARYLEKITNQLEGNEAYSAFMGQVASRRPQLYVGGNSGMLHAFDAETGVETFAFVPTAVFPVLNKLTGQNYSHQYYVDGSPVVADVYDGSKWRTILVGTLRAGGKGLFALDVTDPDNIKLLWELDTNSDAVKNLAVKPGYSFPKPTVARLHNGKWAVVTGNGYKAEGANNGAAALYIIDAISGEMIKSLEVQSATKEPNGLSTPRLADYDSDGVADYAYAGDLHGNLWRFDLLGDGAAEPTVTPPKPVNYGAKNGGTSKFAVSYNGKPMFTATSSVGGYAQPITSAPSLVRHPTGNGYLIVVGTGRYVEIGDKAAETSYAQSLYGIWDTKTKAEPTTSVANAVVTRSDLVAQSITEQVTAVGGKDYKARIITNNPIEWHEGYDSTKSIKKRGWYLDLKGTAGHEGEMMIEDMRTLGRTLFLQTLIPNDDPCAYGSTGWHYAINPATGGHTLHHAWTEYRTQKPGQIIAGLNIQGEGGITIVQRPDGTFELCTGTTCEKISPDPASIGRQTWRVVPDP